MSGHMTASSWAAMRAMPASIPCPTWLPGWKLYMLPGRSSMRARSSRMTSRAKARVLASAEQGFRV